jgi:UDP-N-acetyl-D-mannosaminuronic acid dehydrogenase
MEFNQICVLGLGYIGLPTASTFATHGLKVVGVDTNFDVIETLKNGGLHIHEPGLRTLVQAAINSGNLSISGTPVEADAFIIAVPTPLIHAKDESEGVDSYPKANMKYVKNAVESIIPYLRSGNLVMLESTSPPRTTIDVVAPILERSGLKTGEDFHLAYTPERVLPGQILRELIDNARVIGGIDDASAKAGKELYATFVRGDIICTDATTAEMVKLMENTYRDVNIAIANEFSGLAEEFVVDVWEAINLANRHPRVDILKPGPGVGGHCISVDPWFLVQSAPTITKLIRTARIKNDSQPAHVVKIIERILGGLDRKNITILGLAYKPNVDDLRESPAVSIAKQLADRGAMVTAFEPFDTSATISGITTARSLEQALQGCDILVVLVAHSNFATLKPKFVSKFVRNKVILDTVDLWKDAEWKEFNFDFYKLGVGWEKESGD